MLLACFWTVFENPPRTLRVENRATKSEIVARKNDTPESISPIRHFLPLGVYNFQLPGQKPIFIAEGRGGRQNVARETGNKSQSDGGGQIGPSAEKNAKQKSQSPKRPEARVAPIQELVLEHASQDRTDGEPVFELVEQHVFELGA